jgi:hypothetical protein
MLAVAICAACGGAGTELNTDLVAPNTVVIDRTYFVTQCRPQGVAPAPPPCVITTAASGQQYVDSGRLRLGPAAHNADWMLATHTFSCPCYLGGCSDPCRTNPTQVLHETGSYAISASQVVVNLTSTVLTFDATTIASAVSKTWAGPDSLKVSIQGVNNTATVLLR